MADMVASAAARGERLTIRGGGSKDGVGAPSETAVLDMALLSGVIDYDPAELVLTVGAATPLAEVRALLAGSGQMLAFDPFDHGPLFGKPSGKATIGGVLAAGVAGSQRLSMGGGRDHLLGFTAVSGRGELFVAGAKVVKNVTGYDLPKLAVNSWGRLFAMTQVTLKVVPAPRARVTWVAEGLDFADAQRLMAAAMGSTAEVAAAAYLPGRRRALLRVQGFGPSVEARGQMLAALGLRPGNDGECDALRTLAPLPLDRPLWRINAPPSAAPAMMAGLSGDWLADWAGGLVWLASDQPAGEVRAAAEAAGGHAMLVRGPEAMRRAVAALHPPAAGVAALEARIAAAFDPAGVFASPRMTGAVA
ncbi:glycolate oxidase FAD binding subunit [Sphingomonas jinjuensis]|uniref:Glycolate oxidase FAD binding subunit n=1 Tax=Sphingomonas jinjuensis TaxID=535907 RepID=A0A840F9K9_9SPHN|nr:glycolate oxidase FAD binding subunit [Sphingomonas jinjuensis]